MLGGVPEGSLRSDLADSLITPAMEPLLGTIGVKRLSEAPARIDAIVAIAKAGDSGDPVGFLKQLAELVPPLAALLIEIERTPAIAKVKEACGQLRTALSQAADAFLPRASDLDRIATCIGRIAKSVGSSACTLSPVASFSQEALKSLQLLREAEKLLPNPEDAAGIKKAREDLQSVAGSLATALAELAALRRNWVRPSPHRRKAAPCLPSMGWRPRGVSRRRRGFWFEASPLSRPRARPRSPRCGIACSIPRRRRPSGPRRPKPWQRSRPYGGKPEGGAHRDRSRSD